MQRFSRVHAGAAMTLVALWAVACGPDRSPSDAVADSPSGNRSASEWFTDRAEETGLDFVHFNGASGAFYYPEILPPGVALFDYDNDGDLDVYLVQGKALGPGKPFVEPRAPIGGRLYRNDLQGHTLHFTDVTEASGIVATQYGLGVAAADVDNDGWIDLFLTNFGTNQLLHNNGNGTFTDVSRKSGIVDESGRFAVSASFFDYDRDGWLDLYVGNNVNYALTNERK